MESPLFSNMIACAGASTCRLGICLSRGIAKAIRGKLSADGTNLEGLDALRINISGCPNSCGRHPLADIGLFGAARRANGQLVPQYVLQLGGRVGVGRTRLAQGQLAVPARNVPDLIAELLVAFRRSPHFPDFARFADADGREIGQTLAARYEPVPEFNGHKEYYMRLGRQRAVLAGRAGAGRVRRGRFRFDRGRSPKRPRCHPGRPSV